MAKEAGAQCTYPAIAFATADRAPEMIHIGKAG